MQAGWGERGECGGGGGECGPEWGGECRPEGASEVSVLVVVSADEVSVVVVMVSAGRRDERGECGGGDSECGPEGASKVSVVVVGVRVGASERGECGWWR